MTRLSALIFLLLFTSGLRAQDRAIGQWRSHLPYVNASSVVTDGNLLFVAAGQGFFTYDHLKEEITTYTKVNGMHDIQPRHLAYDALTRTTVIAYANSNIDLFQDLGFYSIPYLRLKAVTGSKTINEAFAKEGLAYLSTDIGIVVLNLLKKEVKETYTFLKAGVNLPVRSYAESNGFRYAATPKGLYRLSLSHPSPQNFAAWQAVDTTRDLLHVVDFKGKTVCAADDSLYVLNADTLQPVMALNQIHHLDVGGDFLYASTNEFNLRLSEDLTPVEYYWMEEPMQTAVLADNQTFYVADLYDGLSLQVSGSSFKRIIPDGPSFHLSWDILPQNGDVWVAHGALSGVYSGLGNPYGLSHFKEGSWETFTVKNHALFQDSSMRDFLCLAKDPRDGTLYAGTWANGLYERKADGAERVIRAPEILQPFNVANTYNVTGLAFDRQNNLWINQAVTVKELGVKTSGGEWYHYSVPYTRPLPYGAAGILVDDNNLKWYYGPSGGGVLVYNDNGTPENGSDDSHRILMAGKNAGGLPSALVYSIAADKTGAIWVGTADGIGVINCPAQVIGGGCEATVPIVQYGPVAGYLFKGENVRSIAVDGGNRKWIGTNNGVWLVNADGSRIIERFTAEDSPLPSNQIQKIAVDPVTGDVYIGTSEGMVSFRGSATDGGETMGEVLVFPNPVPHGYTGAIAVKNLSENADVRITDVSGQLIYRATANGGQFTWNGLDYTGRRPQSGVYLIFAVSPDGVQRHVGKFIYQQ